MTNASETVVEAGVKTSHQDDVVLLLVVAALDLQRDLLADEVAQHGQVLRFLFQKQIDHFLRRQDAEFARIELLGPDKSDRPERRDSFALSLLARV